MSLSGSVTSVAAVYMKPDAKLQQFSVYEAARRKHNAMKAQQKQ